MPSVSKVLRIIDTIIWLVWNASLPPRNIVAFAVFKQSTPASIVTLGRASKIIPITPKGTALFSIVKPLGRVIVSITDPTGLSRVAT